MSDLRDLYQETILDHNRSPRNYRSLADANHQADGYNPLCGDRLTLFLKIEDGIVRDASFEGSGCAISKASASMLTESVKGRTVAEVRALFERFHRMVTSSTETPDDFVDLGKLAALGGVREFPVRVKCASLAWHTLRAALEERDEPVRTE